MLIGLLKSYESLIMNLEKNEANLITYNEINAVKEKIISRNSTFTEDHEECELHMKNFNQEKFVQSNTTKRWKPKKNEASLNMKKKSKCFSCGEWGHISHNCHEAQQENQSSAKMLLT